MDSYGIKTVGGHFRFQELVMTKGIHIVKSCNVGFNYYLWLCFLPVNHRLILVVFILSIVIVITLIIFQGIKILVLIRHNAHLNGYRLQKYLLSSKIDMMCSK